jgi:hypothetical protein
MHSFVEGEKFLEVPISIAWFWHLKVEANKTSKHEGVRQFAKNNKGRTRT